MAALVVTRAAQKDLDALSLVDRGRVSEAMLTLTGDDPILQWTARHGRRAEPGPRMRVRRVGPYRIQYHLSDGAVVVDHVRHRREVYAGH